MFVQTQLLVYHGLTYTLHLSGYNRGARFLTLKH